jgi:hypothetical protein
VEKEQGKKRKAPPWEDSNAERGQRGQVLFLTMYLHTLIEQGGFIVMMS